eukprot:TRINITY_DN11874_c0_g1_i1.p1 TRINITY_DN11874_c0_g1~~TRINITY_DN11874_c0_g1_i1.p1  ORF type:complete len:218 (+),score=9.02 TRINITY_DN11874_c0_g1_i1:59-712(+)
MSTGLNGASIALSFISGLFFLIGCVGYADQKAAIENVAWITSSKNNLDVYFGLRTAYLSYKDPVMGTIDLSLDYGGDSCGDQDFCDKCQRDGQGALGLTIIALIFTTITLALSGALIASANKGMQIANIFMSFIAAAVSLIAIGLFMGECYNAVDDSSNADDDAAAYYYYDDDGGDPLSLKWGPGSILTIIGMLLMWIVVVLQIVATVMTGTTANQA